MQPIIRGIQAVGAVDINYRYNGNGGIMTLPSVIQLYDSIGGTQVRTEIDTSAGIQVAGFRLDGEFLRANPQIASSVVIPILGGGGVALTNNNRTGSLTLNCTKVSTPSGGDTDTVNNAQTVPGAMVSGGGIGPVNNETVYDFVFIAQAQQAQEGGDDQGATICIVFSFNGRTTLVQFEGCTIATVDPLALTGNDAASYSVTVNYLNWKVAYNNAKDAKKFIDEQPAQP